VGGGWVWEQGESVGRRENSSRTLTALASGGQARSLIGLGCVAGRWHVELLCCAVRRECLDVEEGGGWGPGGGN